MCHLRTMSYDEIAITHYGLKISIATFKHVAQSIISPNQMTQKDTLFTLTPAYDI